MWLHNPATGELARFDAASAAAAGRRVEGDLWLRPGAAVPRAHVHDNLIERFEVREGEVGFRLDGQDRLARPGEGAVEVPAGSLHDWWNAGDGIARVRVKVEATDTAQGQPAARFVAMLELVWSLGALGRVNARGVPDPLWLALIAREYRDAIRFVQPPAAVQAALLPVLAAIARRSGRDPLAAELHGPGAACAISDPGDDGLADLLAGTARGGASTPLGD
jgi:hypothetical protein